MRGTRPLIQTICAKPTVHPRACGEHRGSAREDAEVFGIDLAARREDDLVLPENLDAVRLCAACLGQWRLSVRGTPMGLDYAACEAAARGLQIDWAGNFDKLRIMELAMLDVLAARS